MPLSEDDRRATVDRYTARYREHGYSPKALGWDKGKQDLRFDVLTSAIDLRGLSILDIGCGFGDVNGTLERKLGTSYTYTGVDLVPDLLEEARARWHAPHREFLEGDVLTLDPARRFDYALASGVFNHRFESTSNERFIRETMHRAFEICRVGLAFDFLSDKVDHRLAHTHHSAPEAVLAEAYTLTRNVILRNDYMPFEFSIFLRKDDSFDPKDTVFTSYKRDHGDEDHEP